VENLLYLNAIIEAPRYHGN